MKLKLKSVEDIPPSFMLGLAEAVVSLDKAGHVVWLNATATRLLGLSLNESKGMALTSLLSLTYRGATLSLQRIFKQLKENTKFQYQEISVDVFNGPKLVADLNILPLNEDQPPQDEAQVTTAYALIFTDYSPAPTHAEVNNQILIRKWESVSLFLKGQEFERQRMSQELHDGVGQMLVAAMMNLDAMWPANVDMSDHAFDKLKLMRTLLENILKELRSISHNLLPGSLSDGGLAEALSAVVDQLKGIKGIQIELRTEGTFQRFDPNLELVFYRVAQEMLSNAIKHARADRIVLDLISKPEGILELTVSDNGVGFNPQEVKRIKPYGMGLYNIATRIEALGGYLMVNSILDKGTTLQVVLPIANMAGSFHPASTLPNL